MPGGSVAPRPVDQANYYGSPDVDYDRVVAGQLLRPRSSTTSRGNDPAAQPDPLQQDASRRRDLDGAVPAQLRAGDRAGHDRAAGQRARQPRSPRTRRASRPPTRTGPRPHTRSPARSSSPAKTQFAPTLDRARHAAADRHLRSPTRSTPVTGSTLGRGPARSPTATTRRPRSRSSTRSTSARRLQLTGGLRVERYDTELPGARRRRRRDDRRRRPTTRWSAARSALLYKLTDQGNAYVSFGTTKTPPGTANFTLSAQANNQNNPNVDPQESRNLEVGQQVGLLRQPAVADRRRRSAPRTERHLHRRRHGGAAGVQPGRRAAGRRRQPRRRRPDRPDLGRDRQLRLSRFGEPVAERRPTPACA